MIFRTHSRDVALQLSILCLMIVIMAGCGSSASELATAPVVGTVTVNGKPLGKGTVVFVPERGRGANGIIRPDGTFILTTYTEGDGAIVGINKVGVSAWQSDNIEGPHKTLIPTRYTMPDSSGLTCEVKAGQTNKVSLNLSDN